MIDHDQIERASERFDPPEDAFERFTRRHRRTQRSRRLGAALLALAVAAAGIGFAAEALTRDGQDRPVTPRPATPRPSIHARGPALVTPLCEHPPYVRNLPAPYNGRGSCPLTTPAGEYASALLGFSLAWPYTFTLPDGWEVAGIPWGNGLDLRQKGTDDGVSIIVYPGYRKNSVGEGSEMLALWVSEHSDLLSSPVTRIEFSGQAAWQVYVRPRADAPLVSGCRVGTRCVPLLRLMWDGHGGSGSGPETGVALLPNTTSRLIFFGGGGTGFGGHGLSSVVWIWDAASGPGGTISPVVQRLVDSMHFEFRPTPAS